MPRALPVTTTTWLSSTVAPSLLRRCSRSVPIRSGVVTAGGFVGHCDAYALHLPTLRRKHAQCLVFEIDSVPVGGSLRCQLVRQLVALNVMLVVELQRM